MEGSIWAGLLELAAANPEAALCVLVEVPSASVGVLMAEHLSSSKRALRQAAVDWTLRHRELARHTYQSIGCEFGLRLLSGERPRELPHRWPRMPRFWAPEALPRPLRSTGEPLSEEEVQTVGRLLQISHPYLPHAQLSELDGQFAQFAWALMHQWLDAGAPLVGNWAFYALAHLGDTGTPRQLASMIRQWQQNGERARVQEGLEILGIIGSDVALTHLSRLATSSNSGSLREAARQMLSTVAARRGISIEELADDNAPDLGLDANGSLVFDLGSRQFEVTFDQYLRPRERFPRRRKEDDPLLFRAASERWQQLKKDAEAAGQDQIARLERAMCLQRRWSWESFSEKLLRHPLVGHLVVRLVWGAYDADGRLQSTFRVAEDRTLADLEEREWQFDSAFVGLPHPAACSLHVWHPIFDDYMLLQPFLQLHRPVYMPTAEEAVSSVCRRWENEVVGSAMLFSLMRRGWRVDAPDKLKRPLPGGGAAFLELDPGSFDWSENDVQILGTVKLSAGLWGELDPVVASEVMFEVDRLFGA